MKFQKYFWFFLFSTGLIFLTGCATQTVNPVDDLPGFFWGLLHGFIIIFSFIASWFTDYTIYAFPNNGFWYNLGFVFGVMAFLGGGGARASKRK